jgi:hypothetical protein
MMLTRAFLLLLAMMTGLSAAQAAENVRPVHGAPGLSAAMAQIRVVTAEKAAQRSVCAFSSISQIHHFDATASKHFWVVPNDAPIAPRTYRADRARE